MFSDVLVRWGGFTEEPMALYTDVFKLGQGYIQFDGEAPGCYKTNPLIIGHANNRMHRKILFEDTFSQTLEEFCIYDWAFISGCTYFGRCNSAEHQGKLYALIFDIDGVTEESLNNLFSGAFVGDFYPIPQHVVFSGNGVHLYYVFDQPIDLYPNIKTQLKNLKYALTRSIWNMHTSSIEKVQYQGLNQSFRVPGSKTKPGSPIAICQAYRLNQKPTTIAELNDYVREEDRVDENLLFKPTKHTIEEAKELFPVWYQRVIENNEKSHWKVKEDLYNWWFNRLLNGEAHYGHRYFCIMSLAIFAVKCGIYDIERVRQDAMRLLPVMNAVNSKHPFTESDIDSALECHDSRYVTFPRKDIEKLCALPMPANKRNYRKQEQHCEIMRAIQGIVNPDWRNGNGRKPKRDLVREYAAQYPDKNHSQIARELGISRPTVIKWLKQDKG